MEMRKGIVFSGVLHAAAALLFLLGLPRLWDDELLMEQPVVVDLVQIGEKTNPPPKKVEAPEPKPEPPKEEPKPEPKPEPKTEPAPPKPEPAPEPPKPEPKPEPEPLPEPKPEPKPEPPKTEEKPKPSKLAQLKPKAKPKPQPDSFDQLLKTVEKFRDQPKPTPPDAQKVAAAVPNAHERGSTQHTSTEPLSMTVLDAVRAQVERNWNIDAGAKGAAELLIEVRIQMQPDGTVRSATIVDDLRYQTDTYWRSMADSARRAVLLSSPLQGLPQDKYEQWKDIKMRFNPKDIVGR